MQNSGCQQWAGTLTCLLKFGGLNLGWGATVVPLSRVLNRNCFSKYPAVEMTNM